MQVSQKIDSKTFNDIEPITTYLGRRIFLKRVCVHGVDKGLWLQWCHPKDEGRGSAPKYGQFLAPGQPLQDAVHLVKTVIEAAAELELQDEPIAKATENLEVNLDRLFKAVHN